MNAPTLAIYLFGFNLQKIVYPWVASIRSALELADAVYFNLCPGQDNTADVVANTFADEILSGKLWVLDHPWGDHHTVQAKIGNYLLDKIGNDFDFALKLDADEVLHEDSFEHFRQDLKSMAMAGYALGRPNYVHFCPDDQTVWPFIYATKATISRTNRGLRFDTAVRGDACALGGAPEIQTRLVCHHYGKMGMGRRRAALEKERSFQELYSHPSDGIGFPDPKVVAQWESGDQFDYMKVFDLDYQAGKFKPFTGTHPKFVQEWLQERREAERSISGTEHNV